jgi:hypothetical protein
VIVSGAVPDEQAREVFGDFDAPKPIRIVPEPNERH